MIADGGDYLRQRMADVINSSLMELEGSSSFRWVAVIESWAPDGERACWLVEAPGSKPWDTLGLLSFAETLEVVEDD